MMSTINLNLLEQVISYKRVTFNRLNNKNNYYNIYLPVITNTVHNTLLTSRTYENTYNILAIPTSLLTQQARHMIRVCTDFDGLAFETYNKRQFVKRFGITMYVTRDNANLPLKRLMRSIFYKHPDLKSSFEAIHVSRFLDNPPGFNPSCLLYTSPSPRDS